MSETYANDHGRTEILREMEALAPGLPGRTD